MLDNLLILRRSGSPGKLCIPHPVAQISTKFRRTRSGHIIEAGSIRHEKKHLASLRMHLNVGRRNIAVVNQEINAGRQPSILNLILLIERYRHPEVALYTAPGIINP